MILSKVIIFLVICNFWFIKKFGTLFEIWFIASRDYSNKAVYSLILRKVLLLYYFGDFLCNIFGFMEVFFHKTTNSIFWHSYLNCTSKDSILFPFEDLASSKKMIVLVVVWEAPFGERILCSNLMPLSSYSFLKFVYRRGINSQMLLLYCYFSWILYIREEVA